MSKYIDAEKLIAEIRKLRFESCISESDDYYEYAKSEIIDIIDSLQQEQPDLPGIEESGIPGKDYIPVEWVDACEKYGKWKIVKQEQPEVDLEKEIATYFHDWIDDVEENVNPNGIEISKGRYAHLSDIEQAALHFYELGLNARKEE